MFYLFSFLFLGFDITSLLVIMNCKNVFKTKKREKILWILSTPSLIICIISIVVFIIYKYRMKKVKKTFNKIIEDNINKIKFSTHENMQKFKKKLKLRIKYYKHNIFENLIKGIFVFLSPIFIKTIIFQNTTFETIFAISSTLFYGLNFFNDLYIFIKLKIGHCKRKKKPISYYLEKYPLIEKITEIKEINKKYRSTCSENCLSIAFFIGKLFFGLLFVVYFSQIGEKLDNPKNGDSWFLLFIPFYIFFIPLIGYSILHTISLYPIFKKQIWLIIITIFPCNFAFVINSILLPLALEKKINVTPYLIPIFFFIGTLFLFFHLKILSWKLIDF